MLHPLCQGGINTAFRSANEKVLAHTVQYIQNYAAGQLDKVRIHAGFGKVRHRMTGRIAVLKRHMRSLKWHEASQS